jgi:hypothetical protein
MCSTAVALDAISRLRMTKSLAAEGCAKFFSLRVRPAEMLAANRQATTIDDRVPLGFREVNGNSGAMCML